MVRHQKGSTDQKCTKPYSRNYPHESRWTKPYQEPRSQRKPDQKERNPSQETRHMDRDEQNPIQEPRAQLKPYSRNSPDIHPHERTLEKNWAYAVPQSSRETRFKKEAKRTNSTQKAKNKSRIRSGKFEINRKQEGSEQDVEKMESWRQADRRLQRRGRERGITSQRT